MVKTSHGLNVLLSLALVISIAPLASAAEESWVGRLNPFSKKEKPNAALRSGSTFRLPGFGATKHGTKPAPRSKRSSDPSMLTRTYGMVQNATKKTVDTTKATFNKTRQMLAPANYFPTMKMPGLPWKSKSKLKRKPTDPGGTLSSWLGSIGSSDAKQGPRTANEWLRLPRNEPE